MRLNSLVSVLGLATLAVPAGAQAVVPGLTLRADRRPSLDTVVYRRTTTRDGRDSSTGTRTVVLRVIDSAGSAPLLEVVQRFPGGGGEIVDTALAELATLRAVAHRSHQPTRVMRFDFVGNDAVGTVAARTAAGDTTAPVRQTLGGPIFDSNVIDLVVAALPLREGFTAELPFFFFERGGRVPMPVAVRERTTVPFAGFGPREVWIVTVGVPGAPATVWVDTHVHAVLRIRYDIAARGLSFTDERATPLRS
jgi:hypothetical protein